MDNITNVKSAFLDSSFICNILNAAGGGNDPTSKFCLKFLSQLNTQKARLGVSVISITEVTTLQSSDNFVQELLQVLGSDNVEILPYDLQEGKAAKKYGLKFIGTNKLKSFISSFNEDFPDHKILRDHISDDVKIVATALANNYEFILGTDHKTMYPIAKSMGQDMICCHFQNCFNQGSRDIFTYESIDAETEYKKRMGL